MSANPLASSDSSTVHSLMCLHDRNSPQREEIEGFIHARYAASYQANISHYLPFLLANWQGPQLQGVLGLRPGASGPFFVEQYLDSPIERIVAQQQGEVIAREKIIETGNLAANRGSSQLLFVVLTQVLYEAGFRWITFTATPLVMQLLHRLGFAPQAICEADVTCLGELAKDWGTYYDNRPSVVIGDIAQAYSTLQGNELALKLLDDYRPQVDHLVTALHRARLGQRHE